MVNRVPSTRASQVGQSVSDDAIQLDNGLVPVKRSRVNAFTQRMSPKREAEYAEALQSQHTELQQLPPETKFEEGLVDQHKTVQESRKKLMTKTAVGQQLSAVIKDIKKLEAKWVKLNQDSSGSSPELDALQQQIIDLREGDLQEAQHNFRHSDVGQQYLRVCEELGRKDKLFYPDQDHTQILLGHDQTLELWNSITPEEYDQLPPHIRDAVTFEPGPTGKFKLTFGEGSFGNVRLGKLIRDDGSTEFVAVKKTGDRSERDLKQTNNLRFEREEAEIASRLDGADNVGESYGSFPGINQHGDPCFYSVSAFYAGGDGEGFIKNIIQNNALPEETKLPFETTTKLTIHVMKGLSHGLSEMHDRGVYHRDIKPENVIFDEQGTPHFIDFGLATTDSESNEFAGTYGFMPPEVWRNEDMAYEPHPHGPVDVFGLGRTFQCMLTGTVYDKDLDQITENATPLAPDHDKTVGDLAKFIKRMVSPNRKKRPSLDQVKAFLNTLPDFDSDEAYASAFQALRG